MSFCELSDRLAEIAGAVARELGVMPNGRQAWTVTQVDPSYGRGLAVLSGPDSAVLNMQPSYPDETKLTISGQYPATQRSAQRYEIGVSGVKPAATIAKDIKRRLLESYLPELAEVREYNKRPADAAVARRGVMGEIAAMFGQDALGSKYETSPTSARLYVYELETGSCEVTINGAPATINLKLDSLPTDLAYKVLDVLAIELFRQRDERGRAAARALLESTPR